MADRSVAQSDRVGLDLRRFRVAGAIETYRATAARLNEAAIQYEAMEKAAASKIRA